MYTREVENKVTLKFNCLEDLNNAVRCLRYNGFDFTIASMASWDYTIWTDDTKGEKDVKLSEM